MCIARADHSEFSTRAAARPLYQSTILEQHTSQEHHTSLEHHTRAPYQRSWATICTIPNYTSWATIIQYTCLYTIPMYALGHQSIPPSAPGFLQQSFSSSTKSKSLEDVPAPNYLHTTDWFTVGDAGGAETPKTRTRIVGLCEIALT